MQEDSSYIPHPVFKNDELVDICIEQQGRKWHFVGRSGQEAEKRFVSEIDKAFLPVLIGSGLGSALQYILHMYPGPLAVVDKESSIQNISGINSSFSQRIFWVDSSDAEQALKELSRWQMEHGGQAFAPITLPAYLRLDPDYYRLIKSRLEASSQANFWERAKYAKFRSDKPRILLLTSSYFLIGDVEQACIRSEVPCFLVQLEDKETGCQEFVESILKAVLEFRPDFVLTINHLGLDREGILMDLLEKLRLPLASWFVDNPHLILSLYNKLVSNWATIFSWDRDNLQSLRELGFEHVYFLPLATDVTRFLPQSAQSSPAWAADISFVGNSMVYKVAARLQAANLPRQLLRTYKQVALAYGASRQRHVRLFLHENFSELEPYFLNLPGLEQQLAYETLLTWEATLRYRLSCVQELLPFFPLIVGDKGWNILIKSKNWKKLSELNYYRDLPLFYPNSKINFNCTSMQMKGAVNQRVFDVPACGAFLLTDFREQIADLFEPDREVVCFKEQSEIPELAAFYLKHPQNRMKIAQAARKRVLSQHCYEMRLQEICNIMRKIYA